MTVHRYAARRKRSLTQETRPKGVRQFTDIFFLDSTREDYAHMERDEVNLDKI